VYYVSANRDKTVFDEPHRFDVARSPNNHLAFGNGPHFCLGASLARLEIRVLFEELLTREPGIEVSRPGAAHALELHQRGEAPPGAGPLKAVLTRLP
jgi:cytochrome P450